MKQPNAAPKKKTLTKNREKIGEFLRAKRLAAGLSQGEVARALGYSTAQFISNWERNISQPPIQTMRILAKLFRTDEHELFNLILEATLAEAIDDLERKFKMTRK